MNGVSLIEVYLKTLTNTKQNRPVIAKINIAYYVKCLLCINMQHIYYYYKTLFRQISNIDCEINFHQIMMTESNQTNKT